MLATKQPHWEQKTVTTKAIDVALSKRATTLHAEKDEEERLQLGKAGAWWKAYQRRAASTDAPRVQSGDLGDETLDHRMAGGSDQ